MLTRYKYGGFLPISARITALFQVAVVFPLIHELICPFGLFYEFFLEQSSLLAFLNGLNTVFQVLETEPIPAVGRQKVYWRIVHRPSV